MAMDREYIGRYRVLGRLAEGGMGTVLRAMDGVRQREVAIKLPSTNDPQVISRLQKECDVLARLQHHHIVQVFGAGSDTGLPFYIVMEYVDGMTVEELLREQGGRLEPRRALRIAQDVAEALAYAHRPPHRIIHRDIKPANILIRRSDDAVKVTDFGIAAVLVEKAGTTAVGTMAYMAPEQALGKGIDERADLYALGTMLYEMLTGQRPPQLAVTPAKPPSAVPGTALPPDLRAGIDRLLLGLLERDPNRRRPQQAVEVVEQIRRLLEGQSEGDGRGVSEALPSQPTEQASRPMHEPVVSPLLPRKPAPKARPAAPARPAAAPQPQPAGAIQVVQVLPVASVVAGTSGSGKATASLIIGIFAMLLFCFVGGVGVVGLTDNSRLLRDVVIALGVLPGLAGVFLGHLALWEIRRSAGRLLGSGQALAGLILGYMSLALVLLVLLTLYHL
jgi:hypothetical protein